MAFSAEKVGFSADRVTFSPLKVSFRVEFSREFRAKVALFLLYVSSGSRKDRLYDEKGGLLRRMGRFLEEKGGLCGGKGCLWEEKANL